MLDHGRGGRWPLPSGRPAQPAAVLQHLVRPRARLRAGLAELQPRRVPGRQPRPVTHVMPGIWAVLIPVTPFPAAICPGELRAAERTDLLTGRGDCYGERVVCHLRDPLRRCRLCAWPGGPGVVAAAPAAGCSRGTSLCPRDALPARPEGAPALWRVTPAAEKEATVRPGQSEPTRTHGGAAR
jgi:hypothetical protein